MNEKITNPTDCISLLLPYAKKKQEHFGIIFLDSGKNVISKKVLFIGTCNKAFISIREIFWEACKKNAVAIIAFHNHPSGDTAPSLEDVESTKAIKKAGELMGIQLLDHIIVSKYSYYSFCEHNFFDESESENCVAEK